MASNTFSEINNVWQALDGVIASWDLEKMRQELCTVSNRLNEAVRNLEVKMADIDNQRLAALAEVDDYETSFGYWYETNGPQYYRDFNGEFGDVDLLWCYNEETDTWIKVTDQIREIKNDFEDMKNQRNLALDEVQHLETSRNIHDRVTAQQLEEYNRVIAARDTYEDEVCCASVSADLRIRELEEYLEASRQNYVETNEAWLSVTRHAEEQEARAIKAEAELEALRRGDNSEDEWVQSHDDTCPCDDCCEAARS